MWNLNAHHLFHEHNNTIEQGKFIKYVVYNVLFSELQTTAEALLWDKRAVQTWSQPVHIKASLHFCPPALSLRGRLTHSLWHLSCFDVHRGHLWGPDWWVSITAMSQWRQLPWLHRRLHLHLPIRFPRPPVRNQHWWVPRAAMPKRGSVYRWSEWVSIPALVTKKKKLTSCKV